MKLSEAERLKIIESTPYAISDSVLLSDFKWLIKQARKYESLKREYADEMEAKKREILAIKDLARFYRDQ